MSIVPKPFLAEHQALRDILELYASKADELIVATKNKRKRMLHLDRADAIRSARESLISGHAGDFIRFAASRQALPIARRVARQTNAVNHFEKLSAATRLELCKAFTKALNAERRADQRLVESGELFREPGACSMLDYKLAKIQKIRAGLGKDSRTRLR